ncbi:C-type mannose receptor 2 [Oryzias melastigma]|uniref:C-type mannose receptor 2 n=1 Tax=Oryzias melastigma TaxID=30732 RepID=A0A834CLD6_ORYME|nr:C-type mannose receptor 2 [Oryzias melastigma]
MWNTEDCSEQKPFICYEDHVILINESRTWEEALYYCRHHHHDLVTITNLDDQRWVQEKTKNATTPYVWTGLRYTCTLGFWFWVSDEVVRYKNWASPEQVEVKEEFNWTKAKMPWSLILISLMETNTSQKFHLIEKSLNWTNAQRYCRENHTDLISGLQQLDQLNQTWNDSMKEKLENVFIGLYSDVWVWSDKSSFSFRNWNPQRDRENEELDCAALTDQGTWRNDKCGEQRSFICYEDHVILINENRTWEEALYYCRHHHHDLVTITNLEEQRWVQEKTKNATTPYVWTGLRYTCTLGFWFWVSDEVVRYKNWASPEQVNECDMSGAMETGRDHKWVKINDEKKFNFFCSK